MTRRLAPLALALAACTGGDARPAADAGPPKPDQAAKPAPPYAITLFKRVRINSRGKVNVRKADAAFAFDRGPYARVTLEVKLDSSCFPFEGWARNPPPAGQRWPADCDAFDRNFSFILDPPGKKGDPPGFELVRAITPFGGPLAFTLDLTDHANGLAGKHTMRVTISTYSDAKGLVSGSNGGWWVTATLKLTPGKAPRDVLAVVPLVNGSYRDTKGGQATATFTTPAGTRSARIAYRATGHGGGPIDAACIGPAEEFCQRWQRAFLDGKEQEKFSLWRKDCGKLCTLKTYRGRQYCAENPMGAIRSVRASRANWCPGSVTPPKIMRYPGLAKPGKHTFGYLVEKVAPKGSWRVSATFFAYGR